MRILCQQLEGKCSQCGEPLADGLRRACRAAPARTASATPADTIHQQPPGLGDRLEKAFSGAGITEERWKWIKSKVGLPPTCNCAGRKEWLNKVGAEFGDSIKSAVWSALWPREKPLKLKPKDNPPG